MSAPIADLIASAPHPPHITTSLVEVTDKLPNQPPCRVFIKNEHEQPCGSFKIRGLGHQVWSGLQMARQTGAADIRVIISSGGNAGLAAAYAAQYYNIACTVVLPTVSKPEIVAQLKLYGADVEIVGASIFEAEQYLKNVLIPSYPASTYLIKSHAFDNLEVWEGHASIVDEIVTQLGPLDAAKVKYIACSVGGGGLYNGLVLGMERNKFNRETSGLLLVETNQAPTMTKSVNSHKIVHLESVNSVATSLAVSYLSEKSLELFYDPKGYKARLELIDDVDSLRALVTHYRRTGIVVEPACGVALSVIYNRLDLLNKDHTLGKDDIVVVVACGGKHTTLEALHAFEADLRLSKL